MKQILLTALIAILSISFAHAGEEPGPPQPFPSLDVLTRKADLVLRCCLEATNGKERWRVIEALKGDYRPKMFDQETPGVYQPHGHHNLRHSIASRRHPAKAQGADYIPAFATPLFRRGQQVARPLLC